MRRIVPLVIQNYRLFIKICNHRQPTSRTNLLGIGPSVKKTYLKYMRLKPNWTLVTREHSLAIHRILLEGNYDHHLMETVKNRIKQNGRDGGDCPYCGFGEITELDHFLPSSSFPEFSIYTYNLVPSCHRCNNLKRTVGSVAFNPYYNFAITNEFLKCQIHRVAFGSHLYKATFALDLTLLTAPEAALVDQIYLRLDLKNRYSQIATNYIERIRVDYSKLQNYPLAAFLSSRYDSCFQSLGSNHYETAILKCLVVQNAISPVWP